MTNPNASLAEPPSPGASQPAAGPGPRALKNLPGQDRNGAPLHPANLPGRERTGAPLYDASPPAEMVACVA